MEKMSKAFDLWWGEFPDIAAKGSRDLARVSWNAAIEAAANILDSTADDFGAMGNDALMVAMQQPAAEVRSLTSPPKSA